MWVLLKSESMIRSHDHTSVDKVEIRKLERLVSLGESQSLEFKRKASHPEKIVREMIAFANAQGGTVLIGVDDNGTIPGLKYPEEESHVIRESLKHCRPSLSLKETLIPIGNARSVIRYDIAESKRKPHFRVTEGNTKESFIRVDDQSIKASREVLEIAKRKSHKRNIKFHYGEHERLLMKYLHENSFITVEKFMQVGKTRRFIASKKLILLVLANVLQINPHEKGDRFTLAF